MGSVDAGAGEAGMVGGSSVCVTGVAAQAHQRAAGDDAGGAADASGRRMAGTANRRERALRAGADAGQNDRASSGGGERGGGGDRSSAGRAAAAGPSGGAVLWHAGRISTWWPGAR